MCGAGISGRLESVSIAAKLEGAKDIRGDISCGINRIVETAEVYGGDYEVVSQPHADSYLATKDKKLTDNIHVKEIPYYETTNLSEGLTVYIGSEVEFE